MQASAFCVVSTCHQILGILKDIWGDGMFVVLNVLAKALYEISNKVFYWWESGDEVSTEVVKKEIYEILDDCGIKFDELYK